MKLAHDAVVIAAPAESRYKLANRAIAVWRALKAMQASQRSHGMNGESVRLVTYWSLEVVRG
jgi:hypothetical protein